MRADAVDEIAASAGASADAIAHARRRSLAVALLLVAGLAVLLVTHEGGGFLSFAGERRIFASAALLVAAFVGFRLGDWAKLGAVARALDELPAESDETG